MEKRNAELASLIKLNINGQTSKNAKDISCFVKTFYEKLYTKRNDISDSSFFSSIKESAKCIDEESRKMCDQNITLEGIKS